MKEIEVGKTAFFRLDDSESPGWAVVTLDSFAGYSPRGVRLFRITIKEIKVHSFAHCRVGQRRTVAESLLFPEMPGEEVTLREAR